MAIRLSVCSSLALFPQSHDSNSNSNSKKKSRFVMCAKNGFSVNTQIIRSSDHKIKVFEDRSSGIVCYKDENGEITCEGYDDDEGPRFHHQLSMCSCNSRRDAEMIELLQRCLFHVADEGELRV